MKSYFEPKNSFLLVTIPKENCHYSVIEYLDCWSEILNHVNFYNPIHLLINTADLSYRRIPEVECIFNTISSKVKPENIAIVKCNNIYGKHAFESLLKNCPFKGHSILNNSSDGIMWMNTRKPVVENNILFSS